MAGRIPAWFFEVMVAEAQLAPAATWRGLTSAINNGDPMVDLKKITILTLIFWGEKDSIFHREGQDMLLKILPNASLKAYPEIGYALHWEDPAKFTSDLLVFIRSHSSK